MIGENTVFISRVLLAAVPLLLLAVNGCGELKKESLTAAQVQNLVQECETRGLIADSDARIGWRAPTKVWCVPK